MGNDKNLPQKSSNADIEAFLDKVAVTPVNAKAGQCGRLIFAMDATASRGPTWDRACQIQAQMFTETAVLGGLEIQLCYYRGYGEFHSSAWQVDANGLLQQMSAVICLGGNTQIEKVLRHASRESLQHRINAVVFIGDCMEEDPDKLYQPAGELGIRGVPVFMFQEGHDPVAERVFKQIARLTSGAYCLFDTHSAQQLRELLSAVAVYAAGGRRALENFSKDKSDKLLKLTRQLKK